MPVSKIPGTHLRDGEELGWRTVMFAKAKVVT